jgi:hypothetical protein
MPNSVTQGVVVHSSSISSIYVHMLSPCGLQNPLQDAGHIINTTPWSCFWHYCFQTEQHLYKTTHVGLPHRMFWRNQCNLLSQTNKYIVHFHQVSEYFQYEPCWCMMILASHQQPKIIHPPSLFSSHQYSSISSHQRSSHLLESNKWWHH